MTVTLVVVTGSSSVTHETSPKDSAPTGRTTEGITNTGPRSKGTVSTKGGWDNDEWEEDVSLANINPILCWAVVCKCEVLGCVVRVG